jgi:hypothetical protein
MRRVSRTAIAPFVAGIALSAFLLFSVQPLVGRLVLPAFGGVPAAWATVLVSFQTALLVGYGYAHLSVSRLGARRGSIVHLAVLMGALVLFIAAPGRFAEARIPGLPPSLDLLRLLAVMIGLPAVALAATTPLLSAWLTSVRGGPADTRPSDPYRLYAVSNAGSLVAVVAYPFIVEPVLGLSAQRVGFALGLVALTVLFVAAAVVVRRSPAVIPGAAVASAGTAVSAGAAASVAPGSADAGPAGSSPSEPLERGVVARWLFFAAVPAGLLAAVTNFVSTDLIAAPLRWIGPLGIYLATLIVAFGGRGPAIARRLAWLVPIVVVLLSRLRRPDRWPVLPPGHRVPGFGVIGPPTGNSPPTAGARRLTAFYLVIAAGGALGGAFVGLLAPAVFPASGSARSCSSRPSPRWPSARPPGRDRASQAGAPLADRRSRPGDRRRHATADRLLRDRGPRRGAADAVAIDLPRRGEHLAAHRRCAPRARRRHPDLHGRDGGGAGGDDAQPARRPVPRRSFFGVVEVLSRTRPTSTCSATARRSTAPGDGRRPPREPAGYFSGSGRWATPSRADERLARATPDDRHRLGGTIAV